MGDIIDERGNKMPVPGNGRAKRARIDREGNLVAGGDSYYYEADNTRTSIRSRLAPATGWDITTVGATKAQAINASTITATDGNIQQLAAVVNALKEDLINRGMLGL